MKTIKILAFSLMATSAVVLTSCGDDDKGGTTLPPIGGYDNADQVAATDLMAHWPLNGNGTESKTNTPAAASPNTTFVEGVKGQAANFAGGYIAAPVIPALTQITGSASVSLWAKVSNNGTHATMLFSMTRPIDASTNEWNGPLNVLAETGIGNRPITADTLKVKGLFAFNKPDATFFGGDAVNAEKLSEEDIANGGQVVVNKTAGQWMHVVYVYDGSTANNRLYVNGIKISNPQWESRNGGVGVPFSMFPQSKAVIGSFGSVLTGNNDGWQQSMHGQVDEVRLYKKALTLPEINALYELEKAGR